MERQKAVYHPTHSPLREDSEHSGIAGDCVPTHDLFFEEVQCKVSKNKSQGGGRNLSFQHTYSQLNFKVDQFLFHSRLICSTFHEQRILKKL